MIQILNVNVQQPSLATNLKYGISVRLIDTTTKEDKHVSVASDDIAGGIKHLLTIVSDYVAYKERAKK